MMTERTCEGCRWFSVYGDSEKIQGHCVRYAPTPANNLDDEPHATWPVTVREDVCGEWADRSLTAKEAERRDLIRQFAVALVASGSEAMVHQVWQRAAEFADYEGQV